MIYFYLYLSGQSLAPSLLAADRMGYSPFVAKQTGAPVCGILVHDPTISVERNRFLQDSNLRGALAQSPPLP